MLIAADDHVFLAIDYIKVTLRIKLAHINGMQPGESLSGWLYEVPFSKKETPQKAGSLALM